MHALLLPSKPAKPASSILVALLLRTGLDVPPALLSPSPPDPSPLNAVLSAFARNNFPSLALRTFSLLHRLALPLDSYSLCSSLSASDKLPLPPAKQIHAIAHKSAHVHNVFVCGALVHSYSRNADSLRDARRLFDETPVRNTVCANSLLHGYVRRGLWTQGLSLVQAMQQASGLRPDELTLSCVLRISGEAAAVELGRQAHGYLIRSSRGGTGRDVVLLSCLVEMYGKCGLAGKARLVFETVGSPREGRRGRDVVLWTSMLNAYGRNGQFDDVIKAFEEMLAERTEPDGVAFLAVLSACGRSGNVKKGLEFVELMGRSYGLVSGPEHYGCIVDMLCRAGEVEKAWKFANEMVVAGYGKRIGASSWGAILGACRDTGSVEIGVTAARKGLELDPCNVGLLVELSNLYAKVGMWDEIGALREEIRERGLEKHVGNSRLESANY